MMNKKIAAIIPCYKVKDHILGVIENIGKEVDVIYVVDDSCPQKTGKYVEQTCSDKRVRIIYNSKNLGVGGAVMNGYENAIKDGMDILVKIDGDGQMDPKLIARFIAPILKGRADYTKGNRFFNPEDVLSMPIIRIIGNAVLSFLTKMSSGYWNIFDPTNGYTAVSSKVISFLPLKKISNRYFFESDMLFRLNTVRAVVEDVPIKAFYGNEKSNLSITHITLPFLTAHIKNTFKRLIYNYFLRDFSVASIMLLVGVIFLIFGTVYGANAWIESVYQNKFSSSGVVMIATLPIILGVQLLLSFINYDIAATPRIPLNNS